VLGISLLGWCFIIPASVALGYDEDPCNTSLRVFNYVLDGLFWVDLVLAFVTSYYDPKTGRPVTSHKQIARAYMYSWFILDFLAVFPFEQIINAISEEVATDNDS
jgi:hypothetical protein